LTSYFSIHVTFISSSCLSALAKILGSILNRSGESGHPCLIIDRGKVSVFHFSLLWWTFVLCLLVRSGSSIQSYLRVLQCKNVDFCQRIFLHLFKQSCNFCPWYLMCCIMFIDLYMLKHPWIVSMKATGSVLLSLMFNVLLCLVCKDFMNFLSVHQGNWLIIFFNCFCVLFSVLVWGKSCLCESSLKAFLPFLFYEIVWGTWCNFFFMVNPSSPRLCFSGRLLL
jgi:hypothetical protein